MQGLAKQSIYIMKKISQSFTDRISELLTDKVEFGFIFGGDHELALQPGNGFNSVCWWHKGLNKKQVIISEFETPEELAKYILTKEQVDNETERMLVEFGNYLFEKYDVQVFSNDGKNTPIYQRQIHDADIKNFYSKYQLEAPDTKLPSRFQNGDKCQVNFGPSGSIANCEIIKVHFTESKVLYDIKTSWKVDGQRAETRFYNVDSVFVEPAE